MPALLVDLETKEQGRIWLLPPYNYSLRRVGNELSVAVGTVHKWRQELKDEGLLPDGGLGHPQTFSYHRIGHAFCSMKNDSRTTTQAMEQTARTQKCFKLFAL
jgi:transposase-like protein|nr:hypothetical protein [Marortus sp. BJYM1]